MTLTIRRGLKADIPALQALERDAAQSFRAVGYDFCADGPVRGTEEHECGLRDGAIFIVESEDHPAGFIMLWPVDGHAHITEVSVARSFQKRGIGRMLVDTAENWARATGYTEITLTTFRDVPWNAPFYESVGYRAFVPSVWQVELAAVQAEETKSGFSIKPRIAMKKAL